MGFERPAFASSFSWLGRVNSTRRKRRQAIPSAAASAAITPEESRPGKLAVELAYEVVACRVDRRPLGTPRRFSPRLTVSAACVLPPPAAPPRRR
jgi:hypothetical protein